MSTPNVFGNSCSFQQPRTLISSCVARIVEQYTLTRKIVFSVSVQSRQTNGSWPIYNTCHVCFHVRSRLLENRCPITLVWLSLGWTVAEQKNMGQKEIAKDNIIPALLRAKKCLKELKRNSRLLYPNSFSAANHDSCE